MIASTLARSNGWVVGARWTIEPVRPISASMDHLSPEARSANMARIKGADTRPELTVRRALHALGYRFRLHRRDLPGSPDIVLPRLKTVIFVHGCYWHRHPGCRRATDPSTRSEFWQAKFARTVTRDREQRDRLIETGWNVLTIWECETRDRVAIVALIKAQLAQTFLVETGVRLSQAPHSDSAT